MESIGAVKLYVYLEKGLPNRTSHFRKPKMVVFKRTNRKVIGYSAVFVCENERGNEILRLMENPAHSEWKKENYPKNEGKIDKTARKTEIEISKYINNKLEELSKVKTGKKIAFLGLEEYLSIPEDLTEKEEDFDFEGDNLNTVSGQTTPETTDEETGIQTTGSEQIKINPKIKSDSEIKERSSIEPNEEGNEKTTTGGINESSGGDQPGEGDSSVSTGEINEESSTKNRIFINVGFRSFAHKEDGNIYHILVVNTDKKIKKAELELVVGSDNDRDDGIDIKFCNTGMAVNNKIKDVELQKGSNKIKVQFADSLPHSIKLKAYEIQ